MYDRRDGDRTLTFDFGEGLVEDNLLVVDRETDSVWSQLDGKAIAGPLEGDPMRMVPTLQTSWKHWTTLHPDTLVLTVPGAEGRSYHYSEKRGTLGLGITVDGHSLFAPLKTIEDACLTRFPWQSREEHQRITPSHSIEVTLGDRTVRLFTEPSATTAWAEDETGELLPGVLAYEKGWKSFHADTGVLSPNGGVLIPYPLNEGMSLEPGSLSPPQTPRRK